MALMEHLAKTILNGGNKMKIKETKVRSKAFRKTRKFTRSMKSFLVGGKCEETLFWMLTFKMA